MVVYSLCAYRRSLGLGLRTLTTTPFPLRSAAVWCEYYLEKPWQRSVRILPKLLGYVSLRQHVKQSLARSGGSLTGTEHSG